MPTASKKIVIAHSAPTPKIERSSYKSRGPKEKAKRARSHGSSALAPHRRGKEKNTRREFGVRIVRKTIDELEPTAHGDLERLRNAQSRADAIADSSEGDGLGPETSRLPRDPDGRLIKPPPSRIRSAILDELGNRSMTRYKLWKAAQKNCPTLPQSAVYEFLRGFRQIGLNYIEAILAALNLDVVAGEERHTNKN